MAINCLTQHVQLHPRLSLQQHSTQYTAGPQPPFKLRQLAAAWADKSLSASLCCWITPLHCSHFRSPSPPPRPQSTHQKSSHHGCIDCSPPCCTTCVNPHTTHATSMIPTYLHACDEGPVPVVCVGRKVGILARVTLWGVLDRQHA